MSGLLLKSCPICLEAVPFERVLFLLCGHKICDVCISRCKASCVVCRKPIPKGTPHRIYLNMEEIEDNRVTQLIGEINGMSANSDVADLAKVCNDTETLVTSTADMSSPTVGEDILKSIEFMRKRVSPVFLQLESLLAENNALRESLRKSDNKHQASKIKLENASELAEATLQEKCETLERYKSAYKKGKKELEEAQNTILENKKQIHLLKAKIKGLLKQQTSRRHSKSGDLSLQIEDKAMDPQKPLKRSAESSRSDINPHSKRKKDT